ncbi:MAG: hypothetical protein OXU20_00175 [Myxococcales bacterium]|nr:hypothetical protein [Myxococcales bacterium]MDD9970647.1 hypothetical protein [Myxococcales bacterium]
MRIPERVVQCTVLSLLFHACAPGHARVATVLPRGRDMYAVVGYSPTRAGAYSRAEQEGYYTCESRQKSMIVFEQRSVYRGDGPAEGRSRVWTTGERGGERDAGDYQVTLQIACR